MARKLANPSAPTTIRLSAVVPKTIEAAAKAVSTPTATLSAEAAGLGGPTARDFARRRRRLGGQARQGPQSLENLRRARGFAAVDVPLRQVGVLDPVAGFDERDVERSSLPARVLRAQFRANVVEDFRRRSHGLNPFPGSLRQCRERVAARGLGDRGASNLRVDQLERRSICRRLNCPPSPSARPGTRNRLDVSSSALNNPFREV